MISSCCFTSVVIIILGQIVDIDCSGLTNLILPKLAKDIPKRHLLRNYIIYRKPLSWNESQTFCKEKHGFLATFDHHEDANATIESIFKISKPPSANYITGVEKDEFGLDRKYWIGLTDQFTGTGNWLWTGKGKLLSYQSLWYSDQENQTDSTEEGNHEKHCVALGNPKYHLKDQRHTFIDQDCESKNYFICESATTSTTSTTTPKPVAKGRAIGGIGLETLRRKHKFEERPRNRHQNADGISAVDEKILRRKNNMEDNYYDPFLSAESVQLLTTVTTTIRTTTTTPRPSEVLMVEMKEIHRYPGFSDLFFNSESSSRERGTESHRTLKPTVDSLVMVTANSAVTGKPRTAVGIRKNFTKKLGATTVPTTAATNNLETPVTTTMAVENSRTTSATTMAVENSRTTSATTTVITGKLETNSTKTIVTEKSEPTSAIITLATEKAETTIATTVATEKSETTIATTVATERSKMTDTTTEVEKKSEASEATTMAHGHMQGRMVMHWNRTGFTTKMPITNPPVDGTMTDPIIRAENTAEPSSKSPALVSGRMAMAPKKTTETPVARVVPSVRITNVLNPKFATNRKAHVPIQHISHVRKSLELPPTLKWLSEAILHTHPEKRSTHRSNHWTTTTATPNESITEQIPNSTITATTPATLPKSLNVPQARGISSIHSPTLLHSHGNVQNFSENIFAAKSLPNTNATSGLKTITLQRGKVRQTQPEDGEESEMPETTPVWINKTFLTTTSKSPSAVAGRGISGRNPASAVFNDIKIAANPEDDFMELLSDDNELNDYSYKESGVGSIPSQRKLNSPINDPIEQLEKPYDTGVKVYASASGRKVLTNPLHYLTTELPSRFPAQADKRFTETLHESSFIDLIDSDEM
ncbi:unnamed protein product [Allacma fusca]|uniref:C-type lectin domain-containing protein n=1 Tax=Allacma fusca TaxID=39272 RepID=A0A8J2JI93_9HEXA|nr:unnamed protein product [Allacma fusca]